MIRKYAEGNRTQIDKMLQGNHQPKLRKMLAIKKSTDGKFSEMEREGCCKPTYKILKICFS